jgi:hypothetical protein
MFKYIFDGRCRLYVCMDGWVEVAVWDGGEWVEFTRRFPSVKKARRAVLDSGLL